MHHPYLFILFSVPGRNKMERGISKAGENEYLIMQARNQLESHFQQQQSVISSTGSSSSPDEDPPPDMPQPPGGSSSSSSSDVVVISPRPPQAAAQVGVGGGGFIDTPTYTFTLPDLTVYPGKRQTYTKLLGKIESANLKSTLTHTFCPGVIRPQSLHTVQTETNEKESFNANICSNSASAALYAYARQSYFSFSLFIEERGCSNKSPCLLT